MSTEYNFYFDESFHDRKITLKNDKLNILADDKLDDYVGLFWGCKQSDLRSVISALEAFESRFRLLFGLSPSHELKGETINAKNFKYGIRTFNKDAVSFYSDLFRICDNYNLVLQIDIMSKMEWFVRCVFKGRESYFRSHSVNYDAFIYTLTKMLIFYNHPKLLRELCQMESNNDIIQELRSSITEILKAIKGIQRKEQEINAYEQLLIVLDDPELYFQINKSVNWAYYPSFEGLNLLLSELSISSKAVKVIIDHDDATFVTAKQFPFAKVKASDSKSSIQIRLADLLSNFVGRMIFSINNDNKMKEDKVFDITALAGNDLATKRILSNDWFDLSEEKFNLYQLIAKVMVQNQQSYWSVMTRSYSDDTISFFALLKHMNSYKYSEFKATAPQIHAEYVNSRCLMELADHYKTFR